MRPAPPRPGPSSALDAFANAGESAAASTDEEGYLHCLFMSSQREAQAASAMPSLMFSIKQGAVLSAMHADLKCLMGFAMWACAGLNSYNSGYSSYSVQQPAQAPAASKPAQAPAAPMRLQVLAPSSFSQLFLFPALHSVTSPFKQIQYFLPPA